MIRVLLLIWVAFGLPAQGLAVDDLESASASAWTTGGLWHLADLNASACGSAHSGTHAFYFGRDGQCDYADGLIKDASLRSPALAINSAAEATLSFWTRWEVESSNPSCFDQLWIERSSDGTTWTYLTSVGPLTDPSGGSPAVGMASGSGLGGTPLWQFVSVDLSAYIGGTYFFRFRFLNGAGGLKSGCATPADASYDHFLGWMIDDIALGTAPAPATLEKSVAPSFAAPGASDTYTLTARNWDLSPRDLEVWDTLPAGSDFLGASGGGTLTGGVVHWTLPAVPAGNSQSVTLDLGVDPSAIAPSDWLNVASVASTAGGASFTSAPCLLKVRRDGLELRKTADPTHVSNGGTVTFSILLSNYSSATIGQVDLKETYPTGFIEQGQYPAYSGVRSWKALSLAPGESRSYTVWGTLTASSNGQVFTNRVAAIVSGATSAEAEASVTVSKLEAPQFVLRAVYPQPAPSFKPGMPQGATVYFETTQSLDMRMDLYNVLGEKVRSIPFTAGVGKNTVSWDLKNASGYPVASGLYVARLSGDNGTGPATFWARIAVSR